MESTRRDLHSTTSTLSSLLTKFAKLAAQASTDYSSSGVLNEDLGRVREELEGEIQGGLETFSTLIQKLTTHHSTSIPPPTTSASHALERHKEVLSEFQRDYQRTKMSLKEAEQRANLLGSVREEISAFRSNSNSSVTDSLLSERQRIDSSHRMTDEVLGQAYATRAEFGRQNAGLQGISGRINGVISQVPAINSVLSMISSRRNRDAVIMGSVVGGCSLVLLWFVFG